MDNAEIVNVQSANNTHLQIVAAPSTSHDSIAILDMNIDSNLKSDDHIMILHLKSHLQLGILISIKNTVIIETLRHLYNDIVQSNFQYSCILYMILHL